MRVYSIALGIVSMLLFLGCATPVELRKQNPDITLDSTKTAKVVAICIAGKWENGNIGGALPVNMRLTENGYTMYVASAGNTLMVVDVIALENEQSKTIIYTRALGVERFLNYAKECQ